MLNLSQQEYVKKIDDMNKALCQAWDRDQKVKALKIAIQVCIKLQVYSQITYCIPGWKVVSGHFSNSVLP